MTDPLCSGDFAFGRFVVEAGTRQLLVDGESTRAFDQALAEMRQYLNNVP